MSLAGGGGMLAGGTLSADNIQAQLQAAGSVEAPVVCQYVWGARPGHRDELILRDRLAADSGSSESSGSGEPFPERLWCLMDYYDPTSIVDNTGAVVERYGFSAFGLRSILAPNFSPRAVSDYTWDFAFKGQFLDLESGFYNYGYRYYSTELGRWLNRDPLGENDGGNMYSFSQNNSTNRLDLYGLCAVCTVPSFEQTLDITKGVGKPPSGQEGEVWPTFNIDTEIRDCSCAIIFLKYAKLEAKVYALQGSQNHEQAHVDDAKVVWNDVLEKLRQYVCRRGTKRNKMKCYQDKWIPALKQYAIASYNKAAYEGHCNDRGRGPRTVLQYPQSKFPEQCQLANEKHEAFLTAKVHLDVQRMNCDAIND